MAVRGDGGGQERNRRISGGHLRRERTARHEERRFLKAVALASVGGLLGHAVEGALPGALAGGLIAQAAGPGVDFTLDLLDEFLLDGLRKGWHPRMFLGDLKKLRSHD